MEAVAFREVAAPLERAERTGKRTFSILADHKLVFRVIEIPVVQCSFAVRLQFRLRLAQSLAEHIDAPVIVGILESTSRIFLDADIARHVAQTVIIFPAETACRTYLRMNLVGIGNDCLPELFSIIAADSIDIGIGHY